MNCFKLLISASVLLGACSGEKESGWSSGAVSYEDGFKYLKGLNVRDARVIYSRQPPSKAGEGGTEGGYWKIDFSGNESKLVIQDSLGQNHDIDIIKIVKLSDRVLMVDPDPLQIMNLVSPIGPDDLVAISFFQYLSVVDVQTEKLYRWPRELFRILGTDYEWNLYSVTDAAGNVYFSMNKPENPSQIYKLDIGNFTIQPLLPEGQMFTGFSVTADGFVFYWNEYAQAYYVKCPSGSIVPITGKGFSSGDGVYSLEDRKIYLWETVGDNDLRKKEICSAEEIWDEAPLLHNNVRNTVVFGSSCGEAPQQGCFWAAEFDGDGFSAPFQLPDEFRDMEHIRNPDFLVTDRAWYIYGDRTLHKLVMQTYEDYRFPVTDYEIRNIVADRAKPDMHFTGFRYSDGKDVVGVIKATDEIEEVAVTDNNRIIDLIPLN